MTDDHMALLRELAGDLPPLPDEVWNRTLDAAFAPYAAVDSDLVPEMDDRPIVPDDEDLVLDDEDLVPDDTVLDDTVLDDTVPDGTVLDDEDTVLDDGDSESDLLLADDLGIDTDDAGPGDDLGRHLDIDLGHPDQPGDDLL
ncbi:hypothetical protein [Rhodococcus sp. I2R]|uniref:hypothetical protein n=1 Tax=Rhodococcus sp. I2R TaxID=2855445 RepID=UPI001E31BB12|nr:hypothetical protein [Rhodococcus sp. I2R]MCC8929307.1 hypothetical protein [Rhodococcus sp. I2R]